MKTSGSQPGQMSLNVFAAALVCGLMALPAFSQSPEDEPRKKRGVRKLMDGLTWAKMVLPDSLKTDVVVFQRRRMRTPGRPLEFPPYRLSHLIHGLSRSQMRDLFDKAVEMALPDSLKTDVVVLDRSPDTTSSRPLAFLPYGVGHLKRGLSRDEMFALFDVAVEAPTDPRSFSFTLSEDNTEMWQVGCRWTPTSGDWSYQGDRESVPADPAGVISIQCRLTPVGSDQRWTLELEASGLAKSDGPRARGRLTNGKGVYEVRPSYGEDMRFRGLVPLAGYLFAVDQEPVAAATTSARDRLIFRKSVSPRDRSLIAAAACSLLLLTPLSDVRIKAPAETPGFFFTLAEDETEMWHVACRVKGTFPAWWREVDVYEVPGGFRMKPAAMAASIQCDLLSVESHQHSTLQIETSAYADAVSEETRSAGRLTGTKGVYEVSPSYVDGLVGSVPLAGYLFTLNQEPVAAATTHPVGQLIVRNSVAPEDRSLIAASAFALILLTPEGVK